MNVPNKIIAKADYGVSQFHRPTPYRCPPIEPLAVSYWYWSHIPRHSPRPTCEMGPKTGWSCCSGKYVACSGAAGSAAGSASPSTPCFTSSASAALISVTPASE